MSSLNSVSSLNFNPFQYMALLESQASSGSGAAQTSSASGTTATSAASGTTGGTTSLQAQLVTAITSTVQTAEQSGNTSNLNSVIQGAVNQVFQENGINPATLQQDASGQAQGCTTTIITIMAGRAARRAGPVRPARPRRTMPRPKPALQLPRRQLSRRSNQQTADLLALISSTSGGNQSINGFLLNVQT